MKKGIVIGSIFVITLMIASGFGNVSGEKNAPLDETIFQTHTTGVYMNLPVSGGYGRYVESQYNVQGITGTIQQVSLSIGSGQYIYVSSTPSSYLLVVNGVNIGGASSITSDGSDYWVNWNTNIVVSGNYPIFSFGCTAYTELFGGTRHYWWAIGLTVNNPYLGFKYHDSTSMHLNSLYDGTGWSWDLIYKFTVFHNVPPNTPSNPSPTNHATGVSATTDLSWTGGDPDPGDTVQYDVYFEAGDSTPDVLVSNHQSGTTYDPGTMAYSTKYYWQIVAYDNHGASTPGPIWDFTTTTPPPVTVTFQTDPTNGGTITFNGVTYSNGQSVTVSPGSYGITANYASYYAFDHWSSTCGTVTNPNAQTTTVAVSQTGNLKAWFIYNPPPVTITFQTDPTNGGTITFNGVTYSNGQSVTVNVGTYPVTANPNTNYQFDHWSSTCGTVTNPNAQTTTVAVSQTGILKAWFIPPVTVTFQTDPTNGGTITFNGVTYSNGQSVTVSVGTYPIIGNPATGNQFDHWSSTCGTVTNPNTQSTTVAVTQTGTLKSWFIPIPPDDWTVMVYLCADNNLESCGIDDFLEMSTVGSSSNVNIAVQFDRIYHPDPYYDDTRYDNWTTTKRYYVTSGMVPNNANALNDIGEANMGDPQTLIDFASWAMTNYPANHYCLIIWDHGSGWKYEQNIGTKGCGYDDTNNDHITSAELRSAFISITNNGNNPIDLIGFDCCLMQMVEVEYQIRPYGDYMTASEEVIPGFGWDYDTTLQILVGTPSMSAETLGAQFVSDFIIHGGNTLSTVNQGLLNDLRSHVSTLGSLLKNNIYKPQIQQSINDVQKFYDPDFVDLYHFAALIHTNIDNANVRAAAQDVMDDIDNIVTSENHNNGYPNAHGISIYVPSQIYDSTYQNLEFAKDTQWDEFLAWYYKGPNQPPNKPITPSPPDGATGVVTNPILSVLVIDLDGDPMSVSFYKSDGTLIGSDIGVANNTRAEVTWAGLTPGNTYSWYTVASDDQDSTQSDTWSFTTTGGGPSPPETPDRPSGPQFGGVGKTYAYLASTTDPDGDQVSYMWDWGDGTPPVWIGPYQSGEICSTNHTWTSIGFFQVKVKAKDTSGAESDWSLPLAIIMPKLLPRVIPFFEWLFEYFPHAFPVIRHLLGY